MALIQAFVPFPLFPIVSRVRARTLQVLTTLPRKSWAMARENLAASSTHNAACLEIIDSALFVLVLDDVTPKDVHEAASNMLHGTYKVKAKGENGLEFIQVSSG